MIRARIVGGAQLAATFQRLDSEVSAAAAETIAAAAQDVRDMAVENLPRRSRRLAASVTIETVPDGLAATVGSSLNVATYRELGTRRQAARPWLLPAFHTVAPRLRERLKRAVSAAVGSRQ